MGPYRQQDGRPGRALSPGALRAGKRGWGGRCRRQGGLPPPCLGVGAVTGQGSQGGRLFFCCLGWWKVGVVTVSPLLPDWPMEPKVGSPYVPSGEGGRGPLIDATFTEPSLFACAVPCFPVCEMGSGPHLLSTALVNSRCSAVSLLFPLSLPWGEIPYSHHHANVVGGRRS